MSAAEDLSDVKFEYQFKDRDFNKLKEIVYARTGITLGEEKRQLVYSRFAKRIRKLNLQNFHIFLDLQIILHFFYFYLILRNN